MKYLHEYTRFITENEFYQKGLHPSFWKDETFDPSVRTKLLQIANDFYTDLKIEVPIEDIQLTGSIANYTWTDYSDLDLHLVIPGEPSDEMRELFNAKKALWAEQHSITIKGMPVECYVQGNDEEHHSTGVYSLLHKTWLIEPKKVKPTIDDKAVEAKKDAVEHEIERALLSRDLEQLRSVKERITKMRKAGLTRAGEWSVENLVFKILRNLGLIDQITDKIRELEDQELSLEQTQLLD